MRILLLIVLFPTILLAQQKLETYDIKYPGTDLTKKCGDYLNIYRRLPMEARYGVEVVDNIIYFSFPSQKYFDLIFDKNTDGIAIDILRRSQYKCYKKNSFSNSWANRGFLMPPMYRKEMLTNQIPNENGFVIIQFGEVPKKFDPQNIECNLILLQKKYLCGNHAFSNLEFTNWELLEMGMFQDSLSENEFKEVHNEVSKTLRFTIPFKKDQDSFDPSNIKPLYDSLNITDYNIKDINIRAYTSIEGTTKRNIELQNERAESIVNALQSYQKPQISTTISANENWVEFLNDISDTRYSSMMNLSKDEIKSELSQGDLAEEMESILSHHRKAIIELKMQKKFTSEENDPGILLKFFDQNIASKNINEAIYIQSIIFEKIRDEQLPINFIDKLEVPKESLYGPLLNNFAIFNYEYNDVFLYENILNFEKLLQILPGNKKILYNLTVLKIKAWTHGELITNKDDIEKSIAELEKIGLNKSLIRRLKVNYHIILTQYYELKGDYKNKSKSLKEVYWLYSRLDLKDQDILSLSKYLAVYSKFDWATQVLKKRIDDINVLEDLVFYYIRLTINKPKTARQTEYRKFLLNAIDKNQIRFCDLFLPTAQGGYSFQLLNDEYLRKTYCENCYSE